MVGDVLHALHLFGQTLYGGDVPSPRRKAAPSKRAPPVLPSRVMSIVHYGRSDAQYRSIVSEAAAQEACSVYGAPLLNEGYNDVLDLGSAMYVARDAEGRMLGFLVYIGPGANGYPPSFTRVSWSVGGRRIGASEAARRLREGAGAATDVPIGEVLLMCRRDADGSAARRLLGAYAQRLREGVVYTGASRGAPNGRSPATAWRRLGFTSVDTLAVRDGGFEQDAMVLRVRP